MITLTSEQNGRVVYNKLDVGFELVKILVLSFSDILQTNRARKLLLSECIAAGGHQRAYEPHLIVNPLRQNQVMLLNSLTVWMG